MRRMLPHALLLVVLSEAATPCFSQTNPNLQTYFKDYIGLSEDQIAAVRGGQAVAKTLHSRTPEEIFVFGVVYDVPSFKCEALQVGQLWRTADFTEREVSRKLPKPFEVA